MLAVDLVAVFLQQGIELLELAGVGRIYRDVEASTPFAPSPSCCWHCHRRRGAVYALMWVCGLDVGALSTVNKRTAAIIVTRWRNITLPMTLPSFCRKRDEHTEGGNCGYLHAFLRDSPRVRSGLLHSLMSCSLTHGIQAGVYVRFVPIADIPASQRDARLPVDIYRAGKGCCTMASTDLQKSTAA